MATTSIAFDETPLVSLVLRRADDALILGHRLSEWCGHAPLIEEDIALANIALDLVGQARSLYAYAAQIEESGLSGVTQGLDEQGFLLVRLATGEIHRIVSGGIRPATESLH